MTVARLQDGRPEVLAELFDQFGRDIHGVAYVILGDATAAEDVLVDTLLRAFERGNDLRDPTRLRPWLLRIATNLALGQRRRTARLVQLTVLPDGEPAPGVDSESRILLADGLAHLAPRMRAVVALHYYADLAVADVAAVLGITPNTVKSQLRLALEHLRREVLEGPRAQPEVHRV